jgi:hypothetical protein
LSPGEVSYTPVYGRFTIQVYDLIPAIVKTNGNTHIVGRLMPGIGDCCFQLAAGQSAARRIPRLEDKIDR